MSNEREPSTPAERATPREGERLEIHWTELAAVVGCAAAVFGWCWASSGAPSLRVAGVALLAFATFHGAGALALRWPALSEGLHASFPLRLLLGFAIVNTALFLVAWFALQALSGAFFVMGGVVVAGVLRARPRIMKGLDAPALTAALAVALSIAAASLWAQDSLWAIERSGPVALVRPWVDVFFHVAEITAVSGVHGTPHLEDVQFAFVPARFYHYAPYVLSSLVKALSGVTSLAAYGGVFVPVGLLLSGVGAYALAASWWGAWPGFAAAAAVLLLPDAAGQGAGNAFLSYHWMQNVGPAGLYGVALLALSCLLVVRGSARGSKLQVGVGWFVAGAVVVYKAQLFVGAALPLWLYPAFVFGKTSRARRAAWIAGFVAVYVAALWVASGLPFLPLIRFDGSSTAEYLALLLDGTAPGPVRAMLEPSLRDGAGLPMLLLVGAPYVLLCTVGVFALAHPVLCVVLRDRVERGVLILPAAVAVAYLVMALGLAYDARHIGSQEELLHRPFVWVYFLAATWTGGAAALALSGSDPGAPSRLRKGLLVAAAVLLLAVPATRGAAGVQHKTVSWSLARSKVPSGWLDAASWVREHAHATDVVQDSHGDGYLAVTAISERRPVLVEYWIPTQFGRPYLQERGPRLARLFGASSPAGVVEAARELRLDWLLLHPGDRVGWPSSIVEQPAYESGGYRVYRLAP